MAASHIQLSILDSDRDNHLFYSPVSQDAKNILDIGTGDATWYGTNHHPAMAPSLI